MKLLSSLVFTATACGFLSACDSTAPKTVTKTVIDTIYTDRFAQSKAVVYGQWTVVTATDTAVAIFFQDSSQVTAYIPWKHSTPWNLTGTLVDTGFTLTSPGAQPVYFYGSYTKWGTAKKVTEMKGSYFDASHPPVGGSLPAWTAQRMPGT